MHLWTEYEGNTLAGYPVGRLTRSEGRSAFFVTSARGEPALLRLTESHFDEGELIERWQKAAAVSHPGLQAIRDSGQTMFDGVALAFCLLEPSDASLSDVLRERVLSVEEAAEVAEAVAGALAALHAAGLVHGHVDAINVFAMGEVVKLRSDCVRECTGDFEADTPEARKALRQRDVHDLGLLLRRCLTPQWEESTAMQLPSPFDRVVRRALNGTGDAAAIVAEMAALRPPRVEATRAASAEAIPVAQAMSPLSAKPVVSVRNGVHVAGADRVAPARRESGAVRAAGVGAARKDVGVVPSVRMAGANSPAAVSAMLASRDQRPVGTANAGTRDADRSEVGPWVSAGVRAASSASAESAAYGSLDLRRERVRNRLRLNTGMGSVGGVLQGVDFLKTQLAQRKVWVASGAVAAVLGFVLWNTMGGTHHAPAAAGTVAGRATAEATPHGVVTQSTVLQAEAAAQRPATAAAARPQPATESLFASGAHAGWHVIAYTYRYQEQAKSKAVQLRQQYVGLQPQVYSPTGRAPYFVALAGPSDAVSAIALRDRARRVGLPRDTYARNF